MPHSAFVQRYNEAEEAYWTLAPNDFVDTGELIRFKAVDTGFKRVVHFEVVRLSDNIIILDENVWSDWRGEAYLHWRTPPTQGEYRLLCGAGSLFGGIGIDHTVTKDFQILAGAADPEDRPDDDGGGITDDIQDLADSAQSIGIAIGVGAVGVGILLVARSFSR